MNFEAILFDCDGVLVDSEPLTNGVLCAMLNEAGWAISPEACMDTFIGKTVRSEAARIEVHTGHPGVGQWLAGVRLDARGFAAHRLADEGGHAFFGRNGPTGFVEHGAEHAVGEGLAVDKHTVAVKQNCFKFHSYS